MAQRRSGAQRSSVGMAASPAYQLQLQIYVPHGVMSTCFRRNQRMPLPEGRAETGKGCMQCLASAIIPRRVHNHQRRVVGKDQAVPGKNCDMPGTAVERGPVGVRSFHHLEVPAGLRIQHSYDRQAPLPTVSQMLCQCPLSPQLFIINCFYSILKVDGHAALLLTVNRIYFACC
jgi:hypothetical protein